MVATVLASLAGQGLQSDERFTASYVDERIRKGFGPMRIRAELCERGVDASLIERYLDRDEARWQELLARVHTKKYGAAPAQGRSELARRGRFLEYRGFTSGQVSRFLHIED